MEYSRLHLGPASTPDESLLAQKLSQVFVLADIEQG